jgi:hypothetical protein
MVEITCTSFRRHEERSISPEELRICSLSLNIPTITAKRVAQQKLPHWQCCPAMSDRPPTFTMVTVLQSIFKVFFPSTLSLNSIYYLPNGPNLVVRNFAVLLGIQIAGIVFTILACES